MPAARTVALDGVVPRGRRADAQRNVAAILDAAVECLARDADATVSDIAAAAGVGRVTLYGHFSGRAELVDAVFARVSSVADDLLSRTDTTGDPRAALERLVTATWQIVHDYRSVLAAAERELPPERLRSHHDQHLARLERVLRRGRRTGVFRTDLPIGWLRTTYYTVVHAAADECAAGRLTTATADLAIRATLLAAFTPPGTTAPAASR